MTYLQSIILGIVEGISEFLPISSTGHLILASSLLKIPQTDFVKSFEIAIQFGAILSVCVLYWRSFLVNFKVLKRVIAAFIPTGILGLIFYKIIKIYFLGSIGIVLLALFWGGIFLIVFELLHKEKEHAVGDVSNISYKQAFLIGLFQSVSMIPGVSRAAATIIGGLILNLKRKTIVEFSFLLAVPTMLAATGLDIIKNYAFFTNGQIGILLAGFISSFIVAVIVVKWLLSFIQKNTFIWFGVYRIILAAMIVTFMIFSFS